MRMMPRSLSDGTKVPTVTSSDWSAKLKEIAGRELTADEMTIADKMAVHNWTLRVVATELFGAAVVDRYFASR